MIHKKHVLLICLVIIFGLFINNLLIGSPHATHQKDLSEITSEQISRISELIEQTRATNNPYKDLQIKYLENKKDTIINIWRAQDRALLLKQLSADLLAQALEAKTDFATPVLDTRQSN